MTSQVAVESIIQTIIRYTKERNQAVALRVHMFLCRSGMDTHNALGNYVVPMLADVGCLKDARVVFDRLTCRNDYSWNSLIHAYIKCGELRDALEFYDKMREESVRLFVPACIALLQSCTTLKDAKRGHTIHADIDKEGLAETDLHISSTLVDMYAKCGPLRLAQEVFDKCRTRNDVLWNVLIAGYADHERGRKALLCFEQMQKEGFFPTSITLTCVLKACGCAGAQETGRETHDQIERRGLLEDDLVLGNALVDMYAKLGLFAEARLVFGKLQVRDVISWTALLAGYVKHERAEDALTCLEQMEHVGISPNAITYVCSLKACACIEATQKGQSIHSDTVMKGLDMVLTSALVDMYLECSLFAEARQEFDKLEVLDEVLWNGLVSGHKFNLRQIDEP